MIDIKLIRERPEWVKEQVARKGYLLLVDEVLYYDKCTRDSYEIMCNFRAAKRAWGELLGRNKESREENREFLKQLSDLEKDAEEIYNRHKTRFDAIMMEIPNVPHESVPGGPIPYHTMIPS